MRRFFSGLTVLAVLGIASCRPFATYSQDLERARGHYKAMEFPEALALLRVLGEDIAALSPSERALYAYLRGMTDVRLSQIVPQKGAAPAALRACARDWLDLASALARETPGALLTDEVARIQATRAKLIDVEAPPGTCLPPGFFEQVMPPKRQDASASK